MRDTGRRTFLLRPGGVGLTATRERSHGATFGISIGGTMHGLNQQKPHMQVMRSAAVGTVVAAVVLLAAALPAGAATPTWQTTASMRVTGSDVQTVEHLAYGTGGTIYVAGTFRGTVTFGPGAGQTLTATGSGNVYVAAYSSLGSLVWVHRIGNGYADRLGGLATISTGNVTVQVQTYGAAHINTPFGDRVLTAHGGNDVVMAQFAPNDGHIMWARQDGGTGNETAGGIGEDGVGNVLEAGSFTGAATFGDGVSAITLTSAGGSDAFLTKWSNQGGLYSGGAVAIAAGPQDDTATAITMNAGVLAVAGTWKGTANIAGTTLSTTYPSTWVARVNEAFLTGQWVRILRSGGLGLTSKVNSLTADSSGVFVGGTVYSLGTQSSTLLYAPGALKASAELRPAGPSDAFVAHYQSAGYFQWAHLTGAQADYPTSPSDPARTSTAGDLVVAPGGTVMQVGSSDGTMVVNGVSVPTAGGQDAWVAQLSGTSGVITRFTRYGGTGTDRAQGVVGSVAYVGGTFDATMSVPGGGSLTPNTTDGYVLRLTAY